MENQLLAKSHITTEATQGQKLPFTPPSGELPGGDEGDVTSGGVPTLAQDQQSLDGH